MESEKEKEEKREEEEEEKRECGDKRGHGKVRECEARPNWVLFGLKSATLQTSIKIKQKKIGIRREIPILCPIPHQKLKPSNNDWYGRRGPVAVGGRYNRRTADEPILSPSFYHNLPPPSSSSPMASMPPQPSIGTQRSPVPQTFDCSPPIFQRRKNSLGLFVAGFLHRRLRPTFTATSDERSSPLHLLQSRSYHKAVVSDAPPSSSPLPVRTLPQASRLSRHMVAPPPPDHPG